MPNTWHLQLDTCAVAADPTCVESQELTTAAASLVLLHTARPSAGPNSKLKPTPTCVPTPDGAAVVVHRPIAADNSCLFNAVGYCMHHSTNRAPFLRQVVSREVSSDPQV